MLFGKSTFARAQVFGKREDELVCWIAEAIRGTGVWVIREDEGDVLQRDFDGCSDLLHIVGVMTTFPEDGEGSMLLELTPEQRKGLCMSDETYQALNVELSLDMAKRDAKEKVEERRENSYNPHSLERRVDALEKEIQSIRRSQHD